MVARKRFLAGGRGSPLPPGQAPANVRPQAASLGEAVSVANYAGNSIVDFDPLAAPKVVATLSVLQAYAAAFGPDGNLYVAGDATNTVSVYAHDGTLVRVIAGLQSPRSVAFDANGDLYAASYRSSKSARTSRCTIPLPVSCSERLRT